MLQHGEVPAPLFEDAFWPFSIIDRILLMIDSCSKLERCESTAEQPFASADETDKRLFGPNIFDPIDSIVFLDFCPAYT